MTNSKDGLARSRLMAWAMTLALGGGAALLGGCTEQTTLEVELGGARVTSALSADVCIQDNWQAHGNSQNLTCSANDVRVARATNICVHENGGCKEENTCIEGTDVTFTADFEVLLTAKARYDIGIYFATDGGGDDGALTGQCVLNTLDEINAPNTFINLDAHPDVCGDITDANNPQIVHLTITTECVSDGDVENPRLLLPNCTSWRQPGSNEECTQATDAYPGSPSKCNCDDEFAIDISIEEASATVKKTAVEACVTFEVEVENTTETVDLHFNSLTDDPYGDLTDATNENLCFTTCGQPDGAGVLRTLFPGDKYTCRFGAKVESSASAQTNTVTATFQDEDIEPTGSATVLVDLDATP